MGLSLLPGCKPFSWLGWVSWQPHPESDKWWLVVWFPSESLEMNGRMNSSIESSWDCGKSTDDWLLSWLTLGKMISWPSCSV